MAKWDFSADEFAFLLAAGAGSLFVTFRWCSSLFSRRTATKRGAALLLTPPACLVLLYLGLRAWADPQYVANSFDYQLLFLLGGILLLGLASLLSACLGISSRDDALERANTGATLSVVGAWLGITALYIGANVGAGPTIWTTLLPAFVAIVVWSVSWLAVEQISGTSELVCIERDTAAAFRHAAYLLASGAVLGRAIAGDFSSWNSTWSEFITLAWPALLLTLLAGTANFFFRPAPHNPRPSLLVAGILPATLLLCAAAFYIAALGPASIGKINITYEQYMQGAR